MQDSPLWEQIGTGFVRHYYQLFQSYRAKLADLYIAESMLTWEGEKICGKEAITKKLLNLGIKKIGHTITAQDHQPTTDGCILSMVVGQLKADNDQVMGFHQIFLLREINSAWVCTNEMFRLAIHNFA
ncbi:nuclear transport factor 2-like [Phyllopteryx taeniolatus]|nr:nuclear transport factor 2 [Phycodurus eques]XP_061620734.1 nuclear transport factor 2-like [Phyllopteryx taeniolatus]XP_061620735.1 nuclear transport factor 2-like [Phyllopteryx taeniolatus]XP_061620736.1 nuclear transport factor 2-like [Phyllopteryx taeniolatus]XP_061620740.1 nuclear transport factor 2-like [Phyllopteryx taeniolatus]XP_061620741.1 nuclear transport factor 2-like [Phyllopteryx taeniolatus]XP_061620742.1 nuclear transport factor 2-like [Phyllopteryx taeniolatus]XP_0616794